MVSFPGPSAQFNDTSARYLVVPQYPVQGSTPDSTPFRLTAGSGALAVAPSFVEQEGQVSAQGAFDLRLRRIEATLPADEQLTTGPMRAAAAAPDARSPPVLSPAARAPAAARCSVPVLSYYVHLPVAHSSTARRRLSMGNGY